MHCSLSFAIFIPIIKRSINCPSIFSIYLTCIPQWTGGEGIRRRGNTGQGRRQNGVPQGPAMRSRYSPALFCRAVRQGRGGWKDGWDPAKREFCRFRRKARKWRVVPVPCVFKSKICQTWRAWYGKGEAPEGASPIVFQISGKPENFQPVAELSQAPLFSGWKGRLSRQLLPSCPCPWGRTWWWNRRTSKPPFLRWRGR